MAQVHTIYCVCDPHKEVQNIKFTFPPQEIAMLHPCGANKSRIKQHYTFFIARNKNAFLMIKMFAIKAKRKFTICCGYLSQVDTPFKKINNCLQKPQTFPKMTIFGKV